jgi:hypothetical protein
VSISTELARMLEQIRNAPMSSIDRELLKPALAALNDGKSVVVPPSVAARIRDIHARMPKS